ncbi:hypothetical protein KUTeg_011905 [Tegillarca granosa]|uniref:Serine-threonine/tyrosine-protein kinase catalytic domain-containing protein n=1 Tax=Tegillarca granosa TaxID=220873 RepID=A0ABQ9EY13_TEGGR|nr:hypothetical protein KUTeg_011905 [Tegillarca granosa]
MFYSMKFNISNSRAMNEPIANISKEGTVPNTLSDPLLQNKNKYFNPPDFNDNKYPSTSPPHKFPEAKDQPLTMSTHIFYISVGCACAVILLIALAVAVYYLNTQKSGSHGYTDRIKYYDSSSSQALTYQQSQSFLRSETPVDGSVKGSIRNFPSYSSPSPIPELQPPDPKEILSEIAISRQRISLGEMLLEGTFGRIYHGTLLSEGDSHFGADQEITVKAVTDQARCDQIHVFLTECCMMKGLVHQNIQPVIGSCLDESPPYVIYPYSTEGNLKKFLLKCRVSDCGSIYWAFGVTLWELMTLGQQPYSDIDPFEMAAYLQEGYRIAQPVNCPDELFSVMACCWGGNPEERPKFSQLLICLQDFYTALGRYV